MTGVFTGVAGVPYQMVRGIGPQGVTLESSGCIGVADVAA